MHASRQATNKLPSGEVGVCLLRIPRQLDNLAEETWARIRTRKLMASWNGKMSECAVRHSAKIRFKSTNVWILCVAFLSIFRLKTALHFSLTLNASNNTADSGPLITLTFHCDLAGKSSIDSHPSMLPPSSLAKASKLIQNGDNWKLQNHLFSAKPRTSTDDALNSCLRPLNS